MKSPSSRWVAAKRAVTGQFSMCVAAIGLLGFASSAWAQGDPPGCDATGVSISIQAIRGGNPTIGPVFVGDQITYRVRVGHPGGTACNFIGGQLTLTLPNGQRVELAGYGAPTPDVPLITDISPFLVNSPVVYVADPADAIFSGGLNVLVARTDYGSTGFRPEQTNGTFQTDPPQNTASASTSIPLPIRFCGDELVNVDGETCDPPGDPAGPNGNTCRKDCTVCGDGVEDRDEECDDGNNNNLDSCRNDCTEPFCGDGIRDPNEECDDGNNTDGDGCQADCQNPECGDGIRDPGEECDDGNNTDGDGCQANCQNPECGDGIRDAGEECDDGNDNNLDGCRNDCTEPFCGDGIRDPGEECDDGNNTNGDGCSATCTEERDEFAGCTPGFWKQPHHLQYWQVYSPSDIYDDVFGVSFFGDATLLEVLGMGGGAQYALGRHSVAALLNASSDEVEYFYSASEVIDLVQEAYATGNFGPIKDQLAEENERGCTVDKSNSSLSGRSGRAPKR